MIKRIAVCALLLSACATGPGTRPAPDDVLTAAELEARGGRLLLDSIETLRPHWWRELSADNRVVEIRAQGSLPPSPETSRRCAVAVVDSRELDMEEARRLPSDIAAEVRFYGKGQPRSLPGGCRNAVIHVLTKG